MIILQALYFFLPAYIANMAPVFAAKIFGKKFGQPLDCGKTFRGKRIFGDHKTWRGMVSGTLIAILIVWLQAEAQKKGIVADISVISYSAVSVVGLGLALGLGALAGDAIKSFFKRQLNIAPGKTWPVFDQLDFVVGGLLAASLLIKISIVMLIVIVIVSPALHILVNRIGYWLKMKETPW
jgi:CDP-2,3-bis-(O-geranylgeranyl)-sn-glycerol synthase